MMRCLFSFTCLFVAAVGVRRQHSRKRSGAWTARTDRNSGPCASYMSAYKLPVYIPLLCSGPATNLKLRAKASGYLWPRLRLSIDNVDKGFKGFPSSGERTWEVSHSSLSAGLHTIKYSGDRLELKEVVLSGEGASCSFDTEGSFDPESFFNTGSDVVLRVLGSSSANFSEVAKRGIDFSMKTVGTNADNSISAYTMGEGMWEWLFKYSEEQTPGDEWGAKGRMYTESDVKPYPAVGLERFPGRVGENMVIQEPCNTVSNLAYSEAAVWASCKKLPFDSDDTAVMLGALQAIDGGSLFMHASGTRTGQLGDVVPIKLMMLGAHQTMAKSLLARTTSVTDAEAAAFLYLGRTGLATDHAKAMTSLFRGPYSRIKWDSVIRELDLPAYELGAAAVVLLSIESFKGDFPDEFLGGALSDVADSLLEQLGGDDIDFAKNTFRPAARKVFESITICSENRQKVWDALTRFAFTMVDAFLYQEELIQVDDWIRDIVEVLRYHEFPKRWDIFNGERSMCTEKNGPRGEHPQWHENSAQGLNNLISLVGEMVEGATC